MGETSPTVLRVLGCTLVRFGGNWSNGSNDGLFIWNANNTSGNVNANTGRQTLII